MDVDYTDKEMGRLMGLAMSESLLETPDMPGEVDPAALRGLNSRESQRV